MSTNLEARAWIEVRANALRNNFARIREVVGPDVRILPMVKADGYGLGVAEVVRVLEPDAPWAYGVATVTEGVTSASWASIARSWFAVQRQARSSMTLSNVAFSCRFRASTL